MEYFVGTPRIFDSELKHKNKKIKNKSSKLWIYVLASLWMCFT